MPITFVQATLGDEIEVPTLDGKVKYSVPEGHKLELYLDLKRKESLELEVIQEETNMLRL